MAVTNEALRVKIIILITAPKISFNDSMMLLKTSLDANLTMFIDEKKLCINHLHYQGISIRWYMKPYRGIVLIARQLHELKATTKSGKTYIFG